MKRGDRAIFSLAVTLTILRVPYHHGFRLLMDAIVFAISFYFLGSVAGEPREAGKEQG